MISVDNRGFWAFGRDRAPVATFKEGPAPKLTPSYPPRLVEGSKTPIGRAGTRSTVEILKEPPANELGKRVAKGSPLERPKRQYNKGQLGRLTPGFKIPAPVPWSFEAANKALDGVDAKDAIVEDLMRAPLTPQGYIDLLKSLVKAERDATQRDVLRAWRDELTRLAATTDTYERQGRMPDAAIGRRRDELHDAVDRWIVSRPPRVGAPAAVVGGPPQVQAAALPPPMLGVATAVTRIPPPWPPEVPRRPTLSNPLASPQEEEKGVPPPPIPRAISTSLAETLRSKPTLRKTEGPVKKEAEETLLQKAMQSFRQRVEQQEPPLTSSAEILSIASEGRGKQVRARLKAISDRHSLGVSFQGAEGRTNEVIAKEMAAIVEKRLNEEAEWD